MNKDTETYEDFLTLEEVAKILKLERQTVKEYMRRKINPLPVIKISDATYRVKKSDFIEWIKCLEDPRQDI